jgi:hypothetical protein
LVALAVGSVLAAGAIVALPGLAWGAPLQRGDLLFGSSSGLNEVTPAGQLVQTLPGVSFGCIDPNGNFLISPGQGLFNASGMLLPSHWASDSVGSFARCVADGFGHVDLAANGVVEQYDLTGTLLRTLSFPPMAIGGSLSFTFALAPDQCTIYYGTWDAGQGDAPIGRFNMCTDTAQTPFIAHDGFDDDLAVLSNWDVLVQDDPGAHLDPANPSLPGIAYGRPLPANFRVLYVDPDGTSFWECCELDPDPSGSLFILLQYDIASAQLLTTLSQSISLGGLEGVYSPPLFGDADVLATVDSDAPGTAEAFPAVVRFSGQMTRLHVYVGSASTASNVVVGVYSDRNGQPGVLREQGTISNVMPGSWNYVDLPSMSVTAGQRYWMAVLGPSGAGTIRFRDAPNGSRSETSAQHNLAALPASWSTGKTWTTGNLSGYGS